MKPFAKIALIIAAFVLGLILAARLVGIGSRSKAGNEPAGASFSIGKTETHNNLFSSSTSSSTENSTFNSRRVLFVAGNPHPLSQRIATLLAQRLKDCSRIERVETAISPALVAEGTEGPDLFLNINLIQLKEDGVLSRSMKAVLECSLGSAPWQCSYISLDSTTPPLLHFAWNATLENETTFNGIRSDRYADAARSIADEFAKGISNQLETLSANFPVLPELPTDFYGPYQPVADFDFLKELNARRACSYYGLLTHNQTYWKFQTPTNPVPQLQRFISQLEAAQWKLDTANVTNTEDYLLRFHQGDAGLEIFRLRHGQRILTEPAMNDVALEFIAHYRKPFSPAEREAALEKLFAEPQPVERLLPFQNSVSAAQREKFFALVEKTPAASPMACLRLAEIYFDRQQTHSAVNMLLRAKALASTRRDYSTLAARITALTKKISPGEKLNLEVTPQTCRELGFLELTNASQTFELERDLGQPWWYSLAPASAA